MIVEWKVPGEEALEEMAKHAPVVEVGAGVGWVAPAVMLSCSQSAIPRYWASMLSKRGVSVVAYDKCPTSHALNEYHGHAREWHPVRQGDTDVVIRHPDHSLLLCYPPPASKMALTTLST